jgi:hypothetical protein
MFKTIAVAGILAMTMALNGCASSHDIRSDFDPEADFSQYKTYNFFADAGPHEGSYQSFFSQYMVAAISREMDARGYVKSDNPDLLVNFNAILSDKIDVRTTPAPMHSGYYGYRGGFYDPWMSYGYAQETSVSQYTEGTFNIDLVDARRKKLVWEAVGVGRVSQKAKEELQQRVNAGVAEYFKRYPFRAGSGVPETSSK